MATRPAAALNPVLKAPVTTLPPVPVANHLVQPLESHLVDHSFHRPPRSAQPTRY
jgi:hypothetical protein